MDTAYGGGVCVCVWGGGGGGGVVSITLWWICLNDLFLVLHRNHMYFMPILGARSAEPTIVGWYIYIYIYDITNTFHKWRTSRLSFCNITINAMEVSSSHWQTMHYFNMVGMVVGVGGVGVCLGYGVRITYNISYQCNLRGMWTSTNHHMFYYYRDWERCAFKLRDRWVIKQRIRYNYLYSFGSDVIHGINNRPGNDIVQRRCSSSMS